jgi:cytochrome c peroxidase
MGVGDKTGEIAARINALQGYKAQFQKVFQSDATPENMMKAIAAYERTIIGGNTAWDLYRAGNKKALSASAERGWNIFQAIKCNNCHDGILFTDQQYHNIGISTNSREKVPDVGRFNVTKKPEDMGAFKTPTLRDIAKSAPYFHDGSVKMLEEAVDIMLAGGIPNEHLDRKNLEAHKLPPEMREDLLNFLRSLSVDCTLSKPALPQK